MTDGARDADLQASLLLPASVGSKQGWRRDVPNLEAKTGSLGDRLSMHSAKRQGPATAREARSVSASGQGAVEAAMFDRIYKRGVQTVR